MLLIVDKISDRQNRLSDRQTIRQTERTDFQTDRQTDGQTEFHIEFMLDIIYVRIADRIYVYLVPRASHTFMLLICSVLIAHLFII